MRARLWWCLTVYSLQDDEVVVKLRSDRVAKMLKVRRYCTGMYNGVMYIKTRTSFRRFKQSKIKNPGSKPSRSDETAGMSAAAECPGRQHHWNSNLAKAESTVRRHLANAASFDDAG